MLFQYFSNKSKGQGLAEYAIVAALVVVIALAGLNLLGNNLQTNYTGLSSSLAASGNGGLPASGRNK